MPDTKCTAPGCDGRTIRETDQEAHAVFHQNKDIQAALEQLQQNQAALDQAVQALGEMRHAHLPDVLQNAETCPTCQAMLGPLKAHIIDDYRKQVEDIAAKVARAPLPATEPVATVTTGTAQGKVEVATVPLPPVPIPEPPKERPKPLPRVYAQEQDIPGNALRRRSYGVQPVETPEGFTLRVQSEEQGKDAQEAGAIPSGCRLVKGDDGYYYVCNEEE